jgi:hypothetical protein
MKLYWTPISHSYDAMMAADDEKLNPEWDEAKVVLYMKWLRA